MVGRTGKKSAAATRKKTARTNVVKEIDHEGIKELENFLETIDERLKSYRLACTEELKKLDELEEQEFQRARLHIPPEQLQMKLPEVEALWRRARVEREYDVWVEESKPAENKDPFPKIKIPLPRAKKQPLKTVQLKTARRSSVAKPHQIPDFNMATPAYRVRRPSIKLLTTGIKDSKPRPGRIGEIVYSSNGSPVVVVDHTRSKLAVREVNISEVF